MKTKSFAQTAGRKRFDGFAASGLTTADVLILVTTVAMAVLLLPLLARPHGTHCRVSCINHMRQVGLAYRMFSNDHGDKFPWQVSTNLGGSMEWNLSRDAFRHFAAASNELNTPKLLRCPSDLERAPNTDWNSLRNSNLSYFSSLDANEATPGQWLAGDRNLSGGSLTPEGLLSISRLSAIKWTSAIHSNAGNIAFSDGSAQQFASGSLQLLLRSNNLPAIRLAIP